jgi:FkbM family methyltransferase
MKIFKTLHYITNHPLNKKKKIRAVIRFFKWQITQALFQHPIIYPFGSKSKLVMEKGMHGATGNLYCGLDEFEDMAFILHFLIASDEFIDIGANIGSYTILASSETGAKTVSVEPVPSTFNYLKRNIYINDVQWNTDMYNIALGNKKEKIRFTQYEDSTNHVAVIDDLDTIEVNVERFDDIFLIEKITLIKIDVEGFETEVLNGMEIALANPNLIGIVIELNGSGERYNFDESLIKKKLVAFGFEPYFYNPFIKELIKERYTGYCSENIIFLKNINLVKNRLKIDKCFKIEGQQI